MKNGNDETTLDPTAPPPTPVPHPIHVIAKGARLRPSIAHIPFRADCGDQPIPNLLHVAAAFDATSTQTALRAKSVPAHTND